MNLGIDHKMTVAKCATEITLKAIETKIIFGKQTATETGENVADFYSAVFDAVAKKLTD